MSFVGIERSQISMKGSNKFEWRKAKKHLGQTVKLMIQYTAVGQKKATLTRYQTINYCLEKLRTVVDISNDWAGYFVLYDWLRKAVELRQRDIVWRRVQLK